MADKNVWYVVEKLAWNPNNDTIDYCDTLEEANALCDTYKADPRCWDTKTVEITANGEVLRHEELSDPWACEDDE
jgi:hypothetical protein